MRVGILGFLIQAAISALLIGAGMWANSLIPIAFGFSTFGRRTGWALSKHFLYVSPLPIAVALCLVWGIAIAYGVHELIIWLHPSLITKIIFGWGLGAYISIPGFGLKDENAIPPHELPRHLLIEILPFLTYAATSVFVAWLI